MLPADLRILPTPDAVADEACCLIGIAARQAIHARQVFRLVLAGGSTPQRTYERLATTAQDWAAWEIFWGDERCLPPDDPGRNSRASSLAWLQQVAIPGPQIHPIPAERGAPQAAADYAACLAGKLPFDLVLLGMGEDGHTASLFPGAAEFSGPVGAVLEAPKPPSQRVSLNFATLRASRQQLVLVTGGEKAAAVAAWQRAENLPIARAVDAAACLLLDVAAAGSLA
jgi:6-phosphogluconolactonase